MSAVHVEFMFVFASVIMSVYTRLHCGVNVRVHVSNHARVQGGTSLASLRSARSAAVCIVEFMFVFMFVIMSVYRGAFRLPRFARLARHQFAGSCS